MTKSAPTEEYWMAVESIDNNGQLSLIDVLPIKGVGTIGSYACMKLAGLPNVLMMRIDWDGERVFMRQIVPGYHNECIQQKAEIAYRAATEKEINDWSLLKYCFR